MLPWSVIPSAGCPSAAAAATSSSTREAPSSIEYSVWTWRCVNESPTTAAPFRGRTVSWRPVQAREASYNGVLCEGTTVSEVRPRPVATGLGRHLLTRHELAPHLLELLAGG